MINQTIGLPVAAVPGCLAAILGLHSTQDFVVQSGYDVITRFCWSTIRYTQSSTQGKVRSRIGLDYNPDDRSLKIYCDGEISYTADAWTHYKALHDYLKSIYPLSEAYSDHDDYVSWFQLSCTEDVLFPLVRLLPEPVI